MTAADPSPVLSFDDVGFGYGRTPVLRDVDLDVRAGELLAVLGANGSGKTTLMRIGLGLERASSGRVTLFGAPVERFDDHRLIGYVPQRGGARAPVPISVEEVVRTGLAGHLGLLRRPDADQRAALDEVVDRLGLAPLRRRRVAELSGGQQQRVLIARALVTRPRLLVLDEPTTGVDQDARSILRRTLGVLLAEGVAVVYITHDPEGFAGLADRVVELRGGRPVPCADPTAHRHAHPDTRNGAA